MTRLREPVEQAFDRVVSQDQLEVLVLLFADRKKAGPNRGPMSLITLGIGSERLEIRADHRGYAAALRMPGNLRRGGLSLPECFLESFQCD